ncbi:MAG: PAS domain-containing sensor histidine kinase [Raineya sp.]|jgi:PAS domain S-box-containing protein|nr:PAS domain-containing sensor histidine kinase [Raineya sp.]
MKESSIIHSKNDSLFDEIINLLPNPVIIDAIDNGVPATIYCNKKFIDLIGYTSEEIKNHKETHYYYFNQIKSHVFREGEEPIETKIWVRCKDGKRRLFHVAFTLWRKNILISLLTDITDKELFLEMEKLNKLKDRLISIMAHDIRNPLATLQGLLDVLNEDDISPEQFKELVPEINQQIDQVRHLLDNVLNWIKNQLNRNTTKPQILQLNKIIDSVGLLFTQDFKHKNIHFSYDISPNLYVYADKDMLELTLRNLISNAIKFTNHGGQILILAQKQENHIKVKVQDNGVGLNQEKIHKILNGEFVSHTGTNREIGTGLGLNLCIEFIKMNNGSMEIHSEEGKGSEFIFFIPAEKSL